MSASTGVSPVPMLGPSGVSAEAQPTTLDGSQAGIDVELGAGQAQGAEIERHRLGQFQSTEASIVRGPGPRQGEGDGLDACGSKRIDAIIWSSSARSAADAPGRDIVSITSRWPSTSMMYTALRIPPP